MLRRTYSNCGQLSWRKKGGEKVYSHVKTSLIKKNGGKGGEEREKEEKSTNKTPTPLLPVFDILCKVGESGIRDHLKNTHYAIPVYKCGCVKV